MDKTSTSYSDFEDGLENYELLNEIGRGSRSITYIAVCKRGRLRNREIAVKQIPFQKNKHCTTDKSCFMYSSKLHLRLHHPAIVSLFSAFSTSSAHFQVLELCSRGSLQNFLRSRASATLTEGELRGVLKGLISALIYLHKELLVHRDISTRNIFLTDSYQIKLANFGLAIRLSAVDSTACSTSPLNCDPFFASPEIAAHSSHSFSTDLWSLGCVALSCLNGSAPFQTVSEISEDVLRPVDMIPSTASFEANNLITSLLEKDPADRIPLHRISSHPFFDPTCRIDSLKPGIPAVKENSALCPVRPFDYVCHGKSAQDERESQGRNGFAKPYVTTRKPLENVTNAAADLRRLPQTADMSSKQDRQGQELVQPEKRVVSDPLPRRAAGSKLVPFPVATYVASAARVSSKNRSNYLRQQAASNNVCTSGHVNALSEALQTSSPLTQLADKLLYYPKTSLGLDVNSRLPALSTAPLTPQTHKTAQGQITILPSRSLLVDFREGERRRGNKGDQVFVVDSGGKEIQVYSAPHLSSPCCLVEPIAMYSLNGLPEEYWKQYQDSWRIIQQIKKKTPTLSIHNATAKCSLMSNGSQADIEILCHSHASGLNGQSLTPPAISSKNTSGRPTFMRIRLSRQLHSMEIAHCTTSILHPQSTQISETQWTKKTVTLTEREKIIEVLKDLESTLVEELMDFLRISEFVEALACEKDEKNNGQSCPESESRESLEDAPHSSRTSRTQFQSDGQCSIGSSTSTVCSLRPSKMKSLSYIDVAPRPAKLPSIFGPGKSSPRHPVQRKVTLKSEAGSTRSSKAGSMKTHPQQDAQDDIRTDRVIQTRFIPSVGWCIRYSSHVTQGGRYRLMFADGVAMDIDTDEEQIEKTDQRGTLTRHNLRESAVDRDIGKRLRDFEKFVSMFDESSEAESL